MRAIAYSNGMLYACGDFTVAGGTSADYAAWWDGNTWRSFGQTARIGKHEVRAFVVRGNNVYIGGTFDSVWVGNTSLPVAGIVQWNKATDQWFALGSGIAGSVDDMPIIGNELYVGGNFTEVHTVSARDIARWNISTEQWSALNGSIGGKK